MRQEPRPSLPYAGPERRRSADRRQGGERRESLRFESANPGRRSGRDRRRAQGWEDLPRR